MFVFIVYSHIHTATLINFVFYAPPFWEVRNLKNIIVNVILLLFQFALGWIKNLGSVLCRYWRIRVLVQDSKVREISNLWYITQSETNMGFQWFAQVKSFFKCCCHQSVDLYFICYSCFIYLMHCSILLFQTYAIQSVCTLINHRYM